jgi:hypothetical protein
MLELRGQGLGFRRSELGVRVVALVALLSMAGSLYAQQVMPILGSPAHPPSGGSEPIFTEVQAAWGANVSSGTTVSATLANTPAAGNAVICASSTYPYSLTISTIKDNATTANNYTVTPHSPSNGQTSIEGISFAYLLNVPAGAGKTITATMSGTITYGSNLVCEEFHRSAGTWTFDTDIAANSASGNPANTPSITPAVAGELLYGGASAGGGPYVSGVGSPWTVSAAGLFPSLGAAGTEYILSGASGATAINVTLSGTGSWNGLAMALK